MFLPKGIIVCMGPLSFGKLKLFFVLHCAWSENYCFYSTFQIKNNEEKKRGTASARSNNCSCAKEISWKKDIQLANLPQPFAKSFFFFAKQRHYHSTSKTKVVSLTSICNCYKKTIYIESESSKKSNCILCSLMGSSIAISPNPTKIIFQKEFTKIKYITNNSSNGPIRLQFRCG